MQILPWILILLPMVCAFISYAIGKKNKALRNTFVILSGVVELLLSIVLFINAIRGQEIVSNVDYVLGMGLHLKVDGFRALYACITCLMFSMTLIFSKEYFAHYTNRNRYYFFNLLTLGATVGVFLSNDLYTTFVFFEIMSLASYPWVAHDQTPQAMKAAQTYLAVAIFGGMVTLMGMFMVYSKTQSLMFEDILAYSNTLPDKTSLYVSGALIFVGFSAKAGVFPLHIWLPKAHPVAPAPSSALLSGILTKTGIFGVLVVTSNMFLNDQAWGNAMLFLGVITMFLGALFALFSVDLKRTLACSSMSQIGFIMVGVGMQGLLQTHNAFAVWGTVLHMVNHSLIKLALFMIAGVVYMNVHKLNLNDIRGFGRKKPLLNFAFLMGYLGIIGMPLLNGFISKSLLHESIVEYMVHLTEHGESAALYKAIEIVFIVTGGMTAAYMTKLYVALFVEKNKDQALQQKYDQNKKYMTKLSAFAIVLSASILPVIGLFPDLFMTKMAEMSQTFMHGVSPAHHVDYFSAVNIIGAVKSLVIGVVLYGGIRLFLMKKEDKTSVYVNRWPQALDLEEGVYRPVISKVLVNIGYAFAYVCDHVLDCFITLKALPTVVLTLTRGADQALDASCLFLKNSVFSVLKKKKRPPVGTKWTWRLGAFLNGIVTFINKTFRKKKPLTVDFIASLAAWREEMKDTGHRVKHSVSFALLLVCFGVLVTFVYLFFA